MKVFIGDTERQSILYQVAKHSIESKTQEAECFPISLSPLQNLGLYTREKTVLETTDFSITRFLTPFLAGYSGWVLFVDNDIVVTTEVDKILSYADPSKAVMVVKHNYQPTEKIKLDGQVQSLYPRKNWSSVILWNLDHPKNKILTPDLINNVSPLFLHRFLWLSDSDIGDLPREWNYLVGWYDGNPSITPNLIHYTEGGPYFRKYAGCDFSKLWLDEFQSFKGRDFEDADYLL